MFFPAMAGVTFWQSEIQLSRAHISIFIMVLIDNAVCGNIMELYFGIFRLILKIIIIFQQLTAHNSNTENLVRFTQYFS